MKKLLLIIAFLSCISASAQYYPNPRNKILNDNDRMMSAPAKSKKAEKPDVVELSMQKLDEELKLDSFQSAVIRQLLEENQKKEEKIFAEEIPDESKTEKIIELRLKLNDKIKEILRPDQIVLFDNMTNKKKKKK